MAEIRRREDARRMADVDRAVPFKLVRDAGEGEPGDGNTLDGYASVFNSLTIIDSWEGRFKEQFLSGSMKKSFRQKTPIIQFDHGRHAMIGSLPVAAFEQGYPREDTHPELAPDGGAHVVARMHQAPLFEPVREVISTGTVDGMSIRFAPVRERWFWPDGKQVRDTEELARELFRTWLEDVPDDELLRRDIVESSVAEMGPVVWPAYESTSIGVRSLLDVRRDQRTDLAREVAAVLRRPGSVDTTDPIAAPGTQSAGGDEIDAERQAAEASRKSAQAKRARVISMLRRI